MMDFTESLSGHNTPRGMLHLSDQTWLNPPSIYRSAPFWAWNDRLDANRLTRQIRQMQSAGMGGFFMHSRYGLKTPYLSDEWFACVAACVEEARRLGMKAYLYDEDRWPSGTAGGMVPRNHPEMSLHPLVALRGEQMSEEMDRLARFAVKLDDAGVVLAYRPIKDDERPSEDETLISFAVVPAEPDRNEAPYLDTLNAKAVREFIRLTHQAYVDRFGEDFGELIPAIFTDEPNCWVGSISVEGLVAAVPWTNQLPRQFKRRRGYDLRDHLVELAFPLVADEFSKVRHDYYRTVTELFVENFSAQIGRWCGRHGIALTGHYLAETSLAFQVGFIGAAMPHYAHQQWPGIDILTDRLEEIDTVKQCTSVAAQLGRQRVLSELYGCTGWDWPLEGHKFNAGWQYVLGVNFRCPHLSLYSLAGGAKRDYPASIFPHSPWWKYYRTVEDYFARLSLMLTQGKCVRDVLVIHPVESAWGLFVPAREKLGWFKTPGTGPVAELDSPFQSLLVALLDGHYDYDLADESLLERYGRITKDQLAVGKMRYRLVVVPPTVTLRASTVSLLKEFLSAGGSVLFAGSTPDRIDGETSDELLRLLEQSDTCPAAPEAVVAAIEDRLDRRVSITENGRRAGYVWTMLRKVKGGQLLFVQSCDRKAGHDVRVSVMGRKPVVLWDAMTGKRRQIKASSAGGKVEFDLHLPPTGSALVSMGVRVQADEPAETPAIASTVETPPSWKIKISEPNSFPLDFCRFRIKAGEFSDPVPVLLADEKIRAHFGLPVRNSAGSQPWYLAATGRADRKPLGRCEIAFNFHVSETPTSLHVAIERPEDFEIIVNGQVTASEPTGWWVDEDIKTIDIGSTVKTGENELLLRFDYRSDMELEDLHLIGPFGVRQVGPKRTFDGYTLTALPTELSTGSWVGQGLDFYGGAVMYRIGVPDSVRTAVEDGRRVRLTLPEVKCTAVTIHVGQKTFVLPWPPMSADITGALADGVGEIRVEVIGGRKNILGPLHTPWGRVTSPDHFSPHHDDWTDEYLLNDHGLIAPPVFEVMQQSG